MARLLAVEALLLGFGFGPLIAGLIVLASVLVAVAGNEVVLLHVAVNGADDGVIHVVLFLNGEHSGLRDALSSS